MKLAYAPLIDDPDEPDYGFDEALMSESLRAYKRKMEKKAWDESKHPRNPAGSDSGGEFTHAGGDGDSGGVKGLPKNIKIKNRNVQQAMERGAFTMAAKPKGDKGRYDLTVTAKIPDGIEKFITRPDDNREAYYNPKLADLHTFNKGEQYLEATYAKPKEGYSTEIEPLPGDDIIYRGMRAEEYEKYLETGEIVSTGLFNIGDEQKGLTYWATDPATAVSYANSFAPWPHKATFEKPAYVVATKMPKETRRVAGVGENEVGVARAVTKDEILAVWRGDVYSHDPGKMELKPSSYAKDENEYVVGSASSPSSREVWQKIEGDGGDDEPTPYDDNEPPGARDEEDVSEFKAPYQGPNGHGDIRPGVNGYSGQSDSFALNKVLRNPSFLFLTPEQEDIYYALQSEINDSRTTAERIVTRGLDGDFVDKMVPGATVTDRGFMSASRNANWAAQAFASTDGSAVLNITVPKGSKMLTVARSSEDEVILPPGTKLEITSRVKDGRRWRINAKVVR